MTMTAEAKRALSSTIRGLRTRLLDDLHGATESAYRLAVRPRDAGLSAAGRARRRRLETWIEEQVWAEAGRGRAPRGKAEFRRLVEQRAAYTLLNRLVMLRLLEAAEPRRPAVVTGGWQSRAYRDFRELTPALVQGDESYAFLLRLVFEDLASELPGLYGPQGVADLVPVPPATLRAVVDALDAPALATCWTDDMTLGWVYPYWNDPEREALDNKLHHGGKVAPHPIPADAVAHAPASVRDLKILDPAVGSGHFLVWPSTCCWPCTAKRRVSGGRPQTRAGPTPLWSSASWSTTCTA